MKAVSIILALIFSVNAQAGDIDFNGMINEVEANIAEQTKSFGPTTERIKPRSPASVSDHIPMEINIDQGVVLVDSTGAAQTIIVDMGE